MTITLRPMAKTAFPDYCAYFIVDYANEIAANYGYSPEKSRTIAQKELRDDLPDNVSTPDNVLLCIQKDEQDTIGYLWYKLIDDGETVFILDFMVFDNFRGLGYGKAALTALQAQLLTEGVEQIKLRVAFDNKRALNLYEKLGFNTTGYNMVKVLKK